MSQWINQHSFTLLMAAILAFVLIARLRRGWRRNDFFLVGGLALGMVALWFLFRPAASPAANTASVEAQIGVGQPVLLEFQSPY